MKRPILCLLLVGVASCSAPATAPPTVSTATPSAAAQHPAPASSSEPAPSSEPKVSDTFETSAGPVELIPIHHGTLALRFAGKTIVVDPWSKSPAGWLPKADLVLLTDNHPDHLDPKGIEAVRKEGTVFVAPKVVADKLPEAKVLNNGDELSELGVKIVATPMYNHKRGPEAGKLYHEKGRGNGYLLTFGDKRIYLSGDTACTDEMRALEKVDVAIICMNLPYTMPPEEAAECVKAFKPRVAIPFHYRDSDTQVFAKALEGVDGVEVRLRDFYAKP